MKYIILVGDGMGDDPCPQLDGRTPLAAAHTPNMDRLAREGSLGLAQTVPPHMAPGSDVANLSLMGYDPAKYHTGRSPIEAAAMGVDIKPDEVAFRCNLVTLDIKEPSVVMTDYAAGHITTAQAAEIIKDLEASLGGDGLHFYPGASYRHLLVWRDGPLKADTVPPHDRTGQRVDDILGRTGEMEELNRLIRRSWPILRENPTNLRLKEAGKLPANSIWLWGQGTKPRLETYQKRFGLSGVMVSAVDLLKGLGVLAGLEPIEVPGATGYLDTNYAGKVQAVFDGLKDKDFAFLHIEAPDETSHGGELKLKLRAIEDFDRNVVGPLLKGLSALGPHRVLLATDHYTPIECRTHTTQPVPFVIWDSRGKGPGAASFNEALALGTGPALPGHELIEKLIGK